VRQATDFRDQMRLVRGATTGGRNTHGIDPTAFAENSPPKISAKTNEIPLKPTTDDLEQWVTFQEALIQRKREVEAQICHLKAQVTARIGRANARDEYDEGAFELQQQKADLGIEVVRIERQLSEAKTVIRRLNQSKSSATFADVFLECAKQMPVEPVLERIQFAAVHRLKEME